MTKREYRPVVGTVYSWLSQWRQYPPTGDPGFRLTTEFVGGTGWPIDCLLLYDVDRELVGILNRYPLGFPRWEEPMAINVWVHPQRQRRGHGRALLAEAERLWGPIDWSAQRVTPAGRRLAESYRRAGVEA